MEPIYLRVKNWSDFQHYADRRPPWIKLYSDLLGEDDAFMRLDEAAQWQLVRIWIVASRSSSVTLDEAGKRVPVVANDATSLQRSIMSLQKIPLALFIREGWLIPVAEEELLVPDEVKKQRRKRGASKGASTGASTVADTRADTGASPTLRSREPEVQKVVLDQSSGRQFEPEGLPIENELLCARLLNRIGDHADQGTSNVVRSYAAQLPPASLAKVVESIDLNEPDDRARYAVAALRDEVESRHVA